MYDRVVARLVGACEISKGITSALRFLGLRCETCLPRQAASLRAAFYGEALAVTNRTPSEIEGACVVGAKD